jgi:hypothetical protein
LLPPFGCQQELTLTTLLLPRAVHKNKTRAEKKNTAGGRRGGVKICTILSPPPQQNLKNLFYSFDFLLKNVLYIQEKGVEILWVAKVQGGDHYL